MKKVAILTYPGVSLFELGCATELFALPRPEISNWYQTKVISFAPEPITTTTGVSLNVCTVADLAAFDMLVIPSWNTQSAQIEPTLKQRLIDFHQRGGRLLSFCSGAFLIAATGLLNHQQATTHWRYSQRFKQYFPSCHLVDNVLYLYQNNIGCSAGSAAALDLGLAIIRQDFGHQIANQVARRLVISPHRSGGQAQFVETPMPLEHSQFSQTLDWAINHLLEDLTVEDLANRAKMSRRSFDRHFRATLAMTPKEWLNRQKLELAKKLLDNGIRNIDLVAQKSGFGTSLNLRNNFRRYLSISPSQYRQQFAVQAND